MIGKRASTIFPQPHVNVEISQGGEKRREVCRLMSLVLTTCDGNWNKCLRLETADSEGQCG